MRKIIIICAISSGIILRLWNFPDLFYFAIDEEKALYIINGITSFSHFPSVGHPSSIGFRLGPILYYLMAIIYFFMPKTPLVWGYISVVASFFSMVLIYKIGNHLTRYGGIIALILYVFSYFNVLYDRRGWQLSFHSLISLLILFSLVQLKQGKEKYAYVLTFLLIAASQFEVATILFIPTVIAVFIWEKIKLNIKTFALCTFFFLLSQAGLLFFDIRHSFLNTRYLLNYFNTNAVERVSPHKPLIAQREVYLAHNLIPSTLARTLFVYSIPDATTEYANCPQYLSYKQSAVPYFMKLVVAVIIILYLFFIMKNYQQMKKEKIIHITIVTYMLLIFGGISLYTYFFSGEMAEYYLLSFISYFYLIIGYLGTRFMEKNHLKLLAVIFFFYFMIQNTKNIFATVNAYGYVHKIDAVKFAIAKIKNSQFIIESPQTCWYSGGYRYLFTYLGNEPVRSYMDQYLYEYYKTNPDIIPVYTITLLTPELIGENPQEYIQIEQKLKNKALFYNKFGAIEVFITETQTQIR